MPATTAAQRGQFDVPLGTLSCSSFGTSSTVAPKMIGVAIRKEKCAAPSW